MKVRFIYILEVRVAVFCNFFARLASSSKRAAKKVSK